MGKDPYIPGLPEDDPSVFIMPDDFKAWAKSLRDAPRRALSIHELREIWKERQAAIEQARAEENEACARVADERMAKHAESSSEQSRVRMFEAETLAAAIRARREG